MAKDGQQTHAPEGAAKPDGISQIDNWSTWHDEYENEDSELNARKRAVQAQVVAIATQCPPGPVTVVSICGGQAREVIGALENHPRRADVRGRIVELDEENAAFARAWAKKSGLDKLEVVTGDASLSSAYAGLPPADVVVLSGVVGHLCHPERVQLIAFMHQILRAGGYAVNTYYRLREEESQQLRDAFRAQQFEEESFETLPGKYQFTIARNRYLGRPKPLEPGVRVFNFGSAREARAQAKS
jgi:SAM-dependent methyltransferase